jgi:ribonuclease PH
MRQDDRPPDQLRPITIKRHFTRAAAGSVWIQAGRTIVLCTASLENAVPAWKKAEEDEPSGWVTAEYSMLPGSTSPRKRRERSGVDGRSSEIQRLIGRSFRAVVNLAALGPRTVTVDCDVIEADGGTRTLSITGGFVALVDALAANPIESGNQLPILRDSVAAVSVGICDATPLLDLDYAEDSRADVDMNVVLTGSGTIVELQGTAEREAFGRDLLDRQMDLAVRGIAELTRLQREALGSEWPLDLNGTTC